MSAPKFDRNGGFSVYLYAPKSDGEEAPATLKSVTRLSEVAEAIEAHNGRAVVYTEGKRVFEVRAPNDPESPVIVWSKGQM